MLNKLLLVIPYLKAIFLRILMVLTPGRYLNRFRSYPFLKMDMSNSFPNKKHDNGRRHDSTVHYIFYDDVSRHDSSKLVKHII